MPNRRPANQLSMIHKAVAAFRRDYPNQRDEIEEILKPHTLPNGRLSNDDRIIQDLELASRGSKRRKGSLK